MRGCTLTAALVATMAMVPARPIVAQSTSAALPATCGTHARPAAPTDANRRAAREMVVRAQEAAITDDAARARDLYQRAARLDPSDPAIAYALGRAYETAHDDRAVGEYCRFLALTPNAPEAQDVRQRLAGYAARALAAAPPPAPRVVVPTRPSPPNPGGAFATGIFIPGGGQYATHRPAAGLLVTAAVGGILYYALQTQTVHDSTQVFARDPNGLRYSYYTPTTRTDRSRVAPGIAAAAGISLIAAIEAYSHARGEQRAASRTRVASGDAERSVTPLVAPVFTDGAPGVALGMRIGVGH
jgi:tetratricopeptide (TPR) repeat protein